MARALGQHRARPVVRRRIDGQHLSTSLTTIALEPEGDGTRLTYTEQGVHYDGLDAVEGREEGSAGLLDQLGAYLASSYSATDR